MQTMLSYNKNTKHHKINNKNTKYELMKQNKKQPSWAINLLNSQQMYYR